MEKIQNCQRGVTLTLFRYSNQIDLEMCIHDMHIYSKFEAETLYGSKLSARKLEKCEHTDRQKNGDFYRAPAFSLRDLTKFTYTCTKHEPEITMYCTMIILLQQH